MRVFTRWDEVSTSSETDELLCSLALVHIRRLSDESLRALFEARIRAVDKEFLCTYDVDYATVSVGDAINLRQICALFKKRVDIKLKVDKTEAAVRSFISAELLCHETNVIWRLRKSGEFCLLPGAESLLFRAQRKIATILGDVPAIADLRIKFGPGATTQVKRKNASARRKLSTGLACSEDLVECLPELLSELPGWVFSEPGDEHLDVKTVPVQIHDGKLVFVPKSAKTERSVVVEPVLNTLVQGGVGAYIANRLRSTGIDISDQSRNQRGALEGSITGGLATLDLSSASDTIATELVFDLLPIDWAIFLSQFRTGHVSYNGIRLSMQKFSSMGNGFTFPLETLIFYALACACVEEKDIGDVSVYGDDIIIPTYAYTTLCDLLRVSGFVPNPTKSFATGPFRESCGCDYYRGINIRPVYVGGPLAGFDIFRLHNFYARNMDTEVANYLVTFIAPHIRLWGPDGYGDGHLLGDQPLRPHGRERGWGGYTFETYTFRPRREMAVLPGDRVYPAYCTYVAEDYRLPTEVRPGSLRDYAMEVQAEKSPPPEHVHRKGLLVTPLPGVRSYNRIKIYVLA
jgi:hypothetical protein